MEAYMDAKASTCSCGCGCRSPCRSRRIRQTGRTAGIFRTIPPDVARMGYESVPSLWRSRISPDRISSDRNKYESGKYRMAHRELPGYHSRLSGTASPRSYGLCTVAAVADCLWRLNAASWQGTIFPDLDLPFNYGRCGR